MKIQKGKKSKAKKGKFLKGNAGYKTKWDKTNPKNPDECTIVKKPLELDDNDIADIKEAVDNIEGDVPIPPSKLKESAKAMKSAMPNAYEDVHEGKKGKRKTADVVPIGKSKAHKKTGRNRQRDVDKPTDTEVDAAMLEHIIEVDKHNAAINDEMVGPPEPTPIGDKVASAAPQPSKGYGFASKKQGVKDKHLYGTCIRDTGEGMTPSGLPITDFLEGGPFAPPKKELELHSVTKAANEEWSYEELASKFDELQVELLSLKDDYERRLTVKDERISAVDKALFNLQSRRDSDERQISDMRKQIAELRQAKGVKDFHDAHADDETTLAFTKSEVEALQNENNLLMDEVEKLKRHSATEHSEASLRTVANQFNIFKVQWGDDPLKAFMRLSPYDPRLTLAVRQYFDRQCEARLLVSEERKVYQRWASRPAPALRWSVRRRNAIRSVPAEVEGLRNIAVNAAVLRKPSDWHCHKLKVTQCNSLAERNIRFEYLPLADQVCHDAYCKVWSEFKSITPRAEYDAEVQREEQERKREELAEFVKEQYKTPTGKVVLPIATTVLKTARAVKKGLDYELSPSKRKAAEEQERQATEAKAEEASRIKREREENFELEIVKEQQKHPESMRPELAATRNAYIAKINKEREDRRKRIGK